MYYSEEFGETVAFERHAVATVVPSRRELRQPQLPEPDARAISGRSFAGVGPASRRCLTARKRSRAGALALVAFGAFTLPSGRHLR
jgi:hypothetical protein